MLSYTIPALSSTAGLQDWPIFFNGWEFRRRIDGGIRRIRPDRTPNQLPCQ
jgi:hypothetical protein